MKVATTKPSRPPARLRDALAGKLTLPLVISVQPKDPLIKAIRLMHVYSISQLPVSDADRIVGTLNESHVLESLHKGVDFTKAVIADLMTAPLPQLDEEADVQEAYELFRKGAAAILVRRGGSVIGLVTRSDLIAFWSIGHEAQPYQI